MANLLKGDNFDNRYRITGKLKTLSPLHIGTGKENDSLFSASTQYKLIVQEKLIARPGKAPRVSTIIKDHRGKPLIPGSSLRGVMRHWLLSVLKGSGVGWAEDRDYEAKELVELSQSEQIEKAKNDFSRLELLFGTPFNAGKLEVWDAVCLTDSLTISDQLLNWNSNSLTYIDTSVAIDPNTGTAMDKLLYKTEIVPAGVVFELNLVAQNLSDEELGLVLFALQGFNSAIYPIRLGARTGRGYGRVQFIPGEIYVMNKSRLKNWIKNSLQTITFDQTKGDGQKAGYFDLPILEKHEQQVLITAVKTKLLSEIGG